VHIKEKIGPNKRKWCYVSKKKMRSERRLQINRRKQQHDKRRKLKNFSWSWTRIRYRRWWEIISESNLKHSEMWVLQILTMYLPDPKLGTLNCPYWCNFIFGKREWNLPEQQRGEELDDEIGMEDPEDEGEFIDLNVVEDDGACEWENDDDL
jgi:hypothetical protein